MPVLYAPIAPPAAGKSFFVDGLVAKGLLPASAVICPDALREIVTGDRADQSANRQVFEIAHAMARIRLSYRHDVFFDATNLSAQARLDLQHTARKSGADLVWITFPAVTRVGCNSRNVARPNPVPDDVMMRMFRLYEEVDWAALPGIVALPATVEAMLESASVRRATVEGMK